MQIGRRVAGICLISAVNNCFKTINFQSDRWTSETSPNFGHSIKQEVRHEHHLSLPALLCAFLILVIVGLLFLENYTWQEADKHKQNDMKYRYLEVPQPPEGQRILHQVDSLYDSNPDEFRKAVRLQEATKHEQLEDMQRVQEKQEEIKNLQKKWNR